MSETPGKSAVDDFEFKVSISDADILAEIVSDVVGDFKGMGKDRVKEYMDLDETGRHVVMLETERRASGGAKFWLDSLFVLRNPRTGKKCPYRLIVSIEGQGKRNLHYPLKNR